MHFIYFKLY